MLIRVTGRLSNGENFASRVDAASAIEAVAQVQGKLTEAGRSLTDVVEISAKPMEASNDLHFGEPRKPRAKKVETAPAVDVPQIPDAAPVVEAAPTTGKGKGTK